MMKAKLGSKFLIAIGTALLIIMGFGLIWTQKQQKQLNILSAQNAANLIRSLIEKDLERMMANGQSDELPEFVSEMRNLPGIQEFRIIRGKSFEDKKGFAILDSLDQEVIESGKSLLNYNERQSSYREIIPYIAKANCLQCHEVQEGEVLGAASITISQKQIARQMKANSYPLIIFTIFQLLIILMVLYAIIRKIVLKRLQKLTAAAQKISHGDTDVTVRFKENDEIGLLGQAFNTMAINIKNFIEKISSQKAEAEAAKVQAEKNQALIESQQAYLQKKVDQLLQVTQAIANGDLRQSIKADREDEIGRLFASINDMVLELRKIVAQVRNLSETSAASANQVAMNAEELAANVNEQSSQIHEISAAAEEMAATISETTQNIIKASEFADTANKTAIEGAEIVEKSVNEMNEIATVVNASSERIKKLVNSSEKIGEVTAVIDEIADQTNLLALNAAIEAARAGEQGRGFAVVADEVRQLAERTTLATKEIGNMVETIQNETNDTVSFMRKAKDDVTRGVELANRAGSALERIEQEVSKLKQMIEQLATAAEQQRLTSGEISKNIMAISAGINQSAASIEESAKAAINLERLTDNLRQVVGRFQLDFRQENEGAENRYNTETCVPDAEYAEKV